MFYDNFLNLCAERMESPSGVAKKIGLSNAAANGWKNGKMPSAVTLTKLSKYFGVTTEYLLTGENKEKAPSDPGESSVPHAQYREILADSGIRLLLDADANVPQENIDDIVEFIKFKQRKNGR